jgi:hypothetical protein
MSTDNKVYNLLQDLNKENGSNYKMQVLKDFRDTQNTEAVDVLKRVLKFTYDKTISFGVSMKNVYDFEPQKTDFTLTLDFILASLETNLCTREVTGHDALQLLRNLLYNTNEHNAEILEKIINRDQRINIGRTNINKVFKGLITKPCYMRCSLMDKIDRISYPCFSQKKEDGTYRSLVSDSSDNSIVTMSRAGFLDDFSKLSTRLKGLPEGVYIGELLIRSLQGSENRMKANGLINSDTEQDDMYFVVWDYLTLKEFQEGKSSIPYKDRYETLKENIKDYESIEVVETKIVNSFDEAQEHFNSLVSNGFEGTVIKNLDTPFKNHTSPTQIKMKEEAVAEFVITGFQEGEGRLQGTLGAMEYKSSDNQVQGKMGGFSDEIRDYIWENRTDLIGSIVSVKYNGVSKAKGKDTYALMFANFVELRPEKDTADDLKYIKNALK